MEPNFNHRTVLGQYPNMEKSTTQIGKPERATQNRVSALFRDQLKYRYLGNRSDRPNNSNIKEDLVSAHLIQAGYTMTQISRAIYLLRVESKNPNRRLDDNNRAVYSMLRYGVQVKIEAGNVTETVKLIDREKPDANDFVIVEEVTLHRGLERRPGAQCSKSRDSDRAWILRAGIDRTLDGLK